MLPTQHCKFCGDKETKETRLDTKSPPLKVNEGKKKELLPIALIRAPCKNQSISIFILQVEEADLRYLCLCIDVY